MTLNSDDYKMFRENMEIVSNVLEQHNKLVEEQNRILIEILQQIKYLR